MTCEGKTTVKRPGAALNLPQGIRAGSGELPGLCTVVCAHNVVDWIEEALTSVVVQSARLPNQDLVFIDVGSTDGGLEAARRLLARWPIPARLLRVPNRGPSAARNIGWRQTDKEWIQFLDGDDVLHERKLQVQLTRAASSSREVASIFSPWTNLKSGGEGWRRDTEVRRPSFGTDLLSDLLRADNFVHTGSQIFRRSWLEKVGGFNEASWLIEDVELMMRLAIAGAAFLEAECNEPLFLYRRRDGESLSTTNRAGFIDGCFRNARMAEEYWRQTGQLTPTRGRRLLDAYLFAARFYAANDKRRFENVLSHMVRLEPKFVPQMPKRLKYASRVFGYRRAETIAGAYRRIKAIVRESRPT